MSDLKPLGLDKKEFFTTFAGKELKIEIGELAFRTDASVRVTMGETVVMANVVIGNTPRNGVDFFPLMVDYEEKFYASGKISSSRFMKREGRPSDKAILIGRLIDRPIRPLFPKDFRNDVQVVITVLSTDLENEPDILAIIAASTALSITGLPFEGPVAAARIGVIDRKLVVNPLSSELKESRLNLVVAGTESAIMMVEASASEVKEATIIKAFELALESWQPVISLQKEIKDSIGVSKREFELAKFDETAYQTIKDYLGSRLQEIIGSVDRAEFEQSISDLEDEVISKFGPLEDLLELEKESIELSHTTETPERFEVASIKEVISKLIDEEIRRSILDDGKRPDGRNNTEIRPIWSKVSILPRTHGSAIFTRGATQALTITTLASKSQAQVLDTMDQAHEKRYMHHYNFPPYSVGEAKPLRSPGRREIGHGALAERALEAVIPSVDKFPYTIRVVSEIMSSSGSTSMASVCGSTLSLMDAGVPIESPVAGIAMGLMIDKKDKDKYVILSDIQDAEDFAGDMDFKVAGTKRGITALQMDIKVTGLSLSILEAALEQAREGKDYILDKIIETIKEPRTEISKYAPRVVSLNIKQEKIRLVIGKGGETIQRISEENQVNIDIDDSGLVTVAGVDQVKLQKAVDEIKLITAEPEVGKVYTGKVTKVMDFGVFVEILPGVEGLLHISQWSNKRIDNLAELVKQNDIVTVMLAEVDSMGRYNLTRVERA